MEAGIFVFDGADELDVVGPFRVFAAVNDVAPFTGGPSLDVHLVAEAPGPVRFDHGLEVRPTSTFDDCPELDLLVVPGGGSGSETAGRRVQQRNDVVIAFVRERARKAAVTASVCTGAFILAEAGLLNGKRANTHWRHRDELRELMSSRGEPFELVGERVVWDGDLATAGGVTSGIDLALAVVERLCGKRTRSAVEAVLELQTPQLDEP